MNRIKLILPIMLILLASIPLTHALSEALIFPAGNEVVAGTTAGNQLITGICTVITDTCDIETAGSTTVLASNTGQYVFLDLNSIIVNQNGYNSFVTNDLTAVQTTSANTIRVLTITNSTTVTFNNIQPVPYTTGTTITLVLTNPAFNQFETYCTDNNMFLSTTNGVVVTSWQQGNEINESNPNLCGAQRDIVDIPSPLGFLPAKATNTLVLGWLAPKTNAYDGNYICEAPQLSTTYGQYDCGSQIFQNYYYGGGGAGGTLDSVFTNNGYTITDAANYISLNCPTGTGDAVWCALYETAPATVKYVNNGIVALISGEPKIGTTGNAIGGTSGANPDGDSNLSVETGTNCNNGAGVASDTCINIGANFIQGTSIVTSVYDFQPGIWNTLNTTSNLISFTTTNFINPFKGDMVLDDCTYLNSCHGTSSSPPPYPIVSNAEYYTNWLGVKGIVTTNLSNITYTLKLAKTDNFSSKDVIWYDFENFSGVSTSFPSYVIYEAWYYNQTAQAFCNDVHAAGYQAGIYISGDAPYSTPLIGWGSWWRETNSIPLGCFDYVNIQAQDYMPVGAFGEGLGASAYYAQTPGYVGLTDMIIQNITALNPILKAGVQSTPFNEQFAKPNAIFANSIMFKQLDNVTSNTLSNEVTQLGINFIVGGAGCSISSCNTALLSNDLTFMRNIEVPWTVNTVVPQLYSLVNIGSSSQAFNTIEQVNGQYVMTATDTSQIPSNFFAIYSHNGGIPTNVYWVGTLFPPPNDVQPTEVLGETGAFATPSLTANYPTNNGHAVIFYANWTGGEYPYTVNVIISNALNGAYITNIRGININSTYYNASGYTPASVAVQFKANVIITDNNGKTVNSTYIYLPSNTGIQGAISVIQTGQTVTFQAHTPDGALLHNTYNVLYTISNAYTLAPMNSQAYNNINWQSTNSFTYMIPSTWNAGTGNTIRANVIITTAYATNTAADQLAVTSTTSLTINSVYSSSILIEAGSTYNPPSLPTLTLSNTLIDQGQSILFTAGVTNGNQLFAYNYIISNSITNAIIAQQSYTNVQSNSNTYFWTPPANLYTSNTFEVNVVISETGGYSNTVNTLWTPFGYNAALSPSIKLSNTIIDQGQSIAFTANTNGLTPPTGGTAPYTYNWQITNTNGLLVQTPAAMVYVPNYQDYAGETTGTLGGYQALLSNPNSVYVNKTVIFGLQFNSIYAVYFNQTFLTSSNFNSIILAGENNGIVVLALGGYYQNETSWNTVCGSPNAQNALIANILIAVKGGNVGTAVTSIGSDYGANISIKTTNGLEIDAENPGGATWCGGGGNSKGTAGLAQMSEFVNKLSTNLTKINSKNVTGFYASDSENTSYNFNALSTNGIKFFDFADGQSDFMSTGLTAKFANIAGGKKAILVDECLEGAAGCGHAVSYGMAQVGNIIPAGYSMSLFTSALGLAGSNMIIVNDIASNIVGLGATNGNVVVANALYKSVTSASNTLVWTPPANLYTNNAFEVNVTITDSASSTNAIGNTVQIPIGYNSAPIGTVNTISNTVTDAGQYATFTIAESGGTGATFNAELYNVTGSAQQGSNVLITTLGGSNSITIKTGATGTFTYNWIISDTGSTTQYTFTTVSNQLKVNTELLDSWSVANNPIVIGNVETLTATTLGVTGTPQYTYNIMVYNSVGTLVYNSLTTPTSSTSNTVSYIQNSIWGSGTFTANIIITDSATTQNTVTNSLQYNVGTYVTPSAPTLTLSNTFIDQGQSILFTAGVTNGNQLFAYNYIISNSITNAIIVKQSYTDVQSNANTFFWTPPNALYTSNTFEANVVISEMGEYSNTVNTLWTPIGYNSAPTLGISSSNAIIDAGQPEILTISESGGTGAKFNSELFNTTNSVNLVVGTNILITSVGGTNSFTSLNSGYNGINSWLGSAGNYPLVVTTNYCFTNSTYIYCVGGTYSEAGTNGVTTPKVYYAPVTPTGVGTWSSTTPYPTNIANPWCVTGGGNVVCGNGDILVSPTLTETQNTYVATVNSLGIGTWIQQTGNQQIPLVGDDERCVTFNNMIYCLTNGYNGGENTLYVSFQNGVLGNWNTNGNSYPVEPTDGNYFEGEGCSQYAGIMYCEGGYWSATAISLNAVYYAPLTINGVGTWQSTTPYPLNTVGTNCNTNLGYIYCIGGRNAGGNLGYNSVYWAQTSNTGIGTWSVASNYLLTGGVEPYCATSNTGTVTNEFIYCVASSGSNAQYSAALSTLYLYNSSAYDEGTSNAFTFNSQISKITANPKLSAPYLNLSETGVVNTGSTEVFSAYDYGGTPSFTYNFEVFNSVTNKLIANQLGSSSTFSWIIPSNAEGNTIVANVIITDSAFTPETANSIQSSILTIPSTAPSTNPPTLTLANSITPNFVDVLMKYPSDNALITATCSSGDTCQIWKVGGTSALASGTTTAKLAYNALPGSATTAIYANDITAGLTSNGIYNAIIKRINPDPETTITLMNTQGTAVAANTPISFMFNALNFTSWESNSLNNTAVSFTNGTIAYSWLEGNIENEAANANTLYTSSTVMYWFRSPGTNTFLPANTGTATTNTILLIFDIPTNNLIDGNLIGESAQLANTVSTTPYGTYDNGANVFNYYQNFGSLSSLPSGWTDNGCTLAFYTANTACIFSSSPWSSIYETPPSSLSSYPLVFDIMEAQQSTAQFDFGLDPATTPHGANQHIDIEGYGTYYSLENNGGSVTSSQTVSGNPGEFTVQAVSATSFNSLLYDYKLVLGQTTIASLADTYFVIAVGGTSPPGTGYVYWLRSRIYPPNGVMPSVVSYSPTQSSFAPTLTLANSIVSNSIDVIMGSASDNALITVTCAAGDTCQIWKVGGTSALATATTTVTLAYNSLAGSTTTSVYANDITSSATSSIALVRRINVVHPVTVTLTNNQGTAVSASTPLMINLQANNYESWEANSLNNTVLYFKNGTVTYSWLEGNALNEQKTVNTFYTSTNIIYWFEAPPSTAFLPANTGTATTNVIILGFDIVSNNLLDGNFIGEAPQLTCSSPASPSTCSGGNGVSGTYGQYDNGNNIFTFYDNFKGSSLNTNLWVPAYSTGYPGSNILVDNSLILSGLSYQAPTGVNSLTKLVMSGNSFFLLFNETYNPGGFLFGFPQGGSSSSFIQDGGNDGLDAITGSSQTVFGTHTSTVNSIISITSSVISGLASITYSQNYSISTSHSQALQTSSKSLQLLNNEVPTANSLTAFFVRMATAPPNGIMPQTSFSPSNGLLSNPTLTLSNTLIDQGQSILFTATVSGGQSSYTYNFQVVNGVTDVPVANYLTTNMLASNAFFWTPQANLYTGNTFKANVVVVDNTGSSVNTLYVPFGYNSILQTPSLSPSTATIPVSTPQILIGGVSGGTQTYTYNYLVSNGIGVVFKASYTGLGTSNTFTFTPVVAGTYNAELLVTDSATTGVTTNSVNSVITVSGGYTPPSTPTLTLSNTLIDQGQYIKFTATTSGGSANYMFEYNIYAFNSQTSSIELVANQLYVNSITPSNTWVWNTIKTGNLYLGNSQFFANVVVTDSNPTTVNSPANSFGYNAALVAGNPTMSNSIIDTGQWTVFTALPAGGTQPYVTYQWYSGTSTTCQNDGIIIGATSSTYKTQPTLGTYYCYNVKDSATTQVNTNSVGVAPMQSAVFNSPSISTPAPSSQQVGNTLTWTTTFTGGSSPFTYNWQVTNTATGTVLASLIEVGNPSFSWIIPSVDAGNAVWAQVAITDSATTNEMATSPYSGAITLVYLPFSITTTSYMTPWGAINTITVTPNPITDGSNIMVNGVQVASQTSGTSSYSTTSLEIGSFAVSGCDTTINSCGSLSQNIIVYVPLYSENSLGTTGTSPGTEGVPTNQLDNYFPTYIFTSSPSPIFSYTLNQLYDNGNAAVLQTSVTDINYLPPTNQPSGNYLYTIIEQQASPTFTTLSFTYNSLTNMTDITNALTLNAPVIQYFPNLANVPQYSFTATPTSWKLWSYPANSQAASYGINTISGSVFSSSYVTFPVNIQLVYPFTSFNISLQNNPNVQTTITQNVFQIINTTANIITQQIYTINSFVEPQYTPINTFTQLQAILTLNNYTVPIVYTSASQNSLNLYIPLSNFQNPSFILTNQSTQSSSSGYSPRVNGWYPFTQIPGSTLPNWQTFNVFLPSSVNTSLYVINVYQCVGFASNYYIQTLNGGNKVVQQVFIGHSTSGISLPLLNGFQYAFRVLNSLGGVIYQSGLSVFNPSTAVPIYIPCANNTVPTVNPPQISITCYTTPYYINSIATCNGTDVSGDTQSWTVLILNYSNPLGYPFVVNSYQAAGNSFTTNFYLPANNYVYYAKVNANVSFLKDPSNATYIYGFQLQNQFPLTNNGLAQYNWLFALAFIMIPLIFAYYHRTGFLILTGVILWFGAAIGVFSFTLGDLGALTALIVIMIIIDERTG